MRVRVRLAAAILSTSWWGCVPAEPTRPISLVPAAIGSASASPAPEAPLTGAAELAWRGPMPAERVRVRALESLRAQLFAILRARSRHTTAEIFAIPLPGREPFEGEELYQRLVSIDRAARTLGVANARGYLLHGMSNKGHEGAARRLATDGGKAEGLSPEERELGNEQLASLILHVFDTLERAPSPLDTEASCTETQARAALAVDQIVVQLLQDRAMQHQELAAYVPLPVAVEKVALALLAEEKSVSASVHQQQASVAAIARLRTMLRRAAKLSGDHRAEKMPEPSRSPDFEGANDNHTFLYLRHTLNVHRGALARWIEVRSRPRSHYEKRLEHTETGLGGFDAIELTPDLAVREGSMAAVAKAAEPLASHPYPMTIKLADLQKYSDASKACAR